MDNLVSAQQCLIPQISGNLTSVCINGGTVIINHYSDHVYVFLMRDFSLEETLYAKHAYDQFLSLIGIIAKAYHADSG
jgi:hypothetical protein